MTWGFRFIVFGALVWPALARADDKDKDKDKKDAAVQIDFDDPDAGKDDKAPGDDAYVPYAPPIESIFQNPALAANLAQGADAINRSVETLFDSIFYSVLDNEKNVYITKSSWFNAGLKRDVYSTPSGAYVVVDRFTLGPRYAKELWRVQDIPISLGIDGSVEVLQIYLRTDGMRLAEQQELSPMRRMANDWFGILSGLASILPPSFNQNELYDPARELETPFSFPLDTDKFYSMPVGSIRSYAISGGVRVTADFGGLLDGASQKLLDRIGGLQEGVPYSIFKRGEHRINVLRRSEHSAWVGVTDLSRTGHGISPLVAQKYYILHGALAAKVWKYNWMWTGVPISVLPINLEFEQAAADLFDQVYEYDLRNPAAQNAYKSAVRGDFVASRLRYLDAKERGVDTGVTFHFARQQQRGETVSTNGPNVAVYKRERKRYHDEGEVEITDPEGKFYVLESELDVDDKRWDVLVGEEESRLQQSVEMRVKRVVDKDHPDDPHAYTYSFDVDPDPYRLTVALNIQDKYVDTVDYERYLDELRFFTALPLAEVPKFPRRDSEALASWRQLGYFSGPQEQVSLVHVTPTYLGKIGAQAAMTFGTKELDRIIGSSEDQLWGAFARAFGLDEAEWSSAERRATFGFQLRWFEAFFLYPLRLVNIRYPQADAIAEATNAVAQLMRLKALETPLAKLDAFKRLLDTDHPRELARALLELTDKSQVPRHITFSAQPKGSASRAVKTAYGKLNNMTFRGGPPFPMPGRYARAKAKLANFYLDQPREAEHRPRIAKVQLTTREIPASIRSLQDTPEGSNKGQNLLRQIDRQAFLTFSVHDMVTDWPLKVYVRIEEAGKIKLGKLELAEKVLELTPLEKTAGADKTLTYELFLTGPLSPLNNYMLNQATVAGDEFLVTMAVSKDGAVWSDERTLEFRFDQGRLFPVK